MRRKYVGVLVMAALLLGVVGCKWDKRLPFRENELDSALLGFWWKVLPDTTLSFALYTQALVEFKRGAEGGTMQLWRAYGGEPYQHVAPASPEPVFTKGGLLYTMGHGALEAFIQALPYSLRGDTLTIVRGEALDEYPIRYVRVNDTARLDWVGRHKAREGE